MSKMTNEERAIKATDAIELRTSLIRWHSSVYNDVKQIILSALNEAVKEKNADARSKLLADFETALTDLMIEYTGEADRIGEEFRSSGIKTELNRLLKERKFYFQNKELELVLKMEEEIKQMEIDSPKINEADLSPKKWACTVAELKELLED